VNEKTPSTTKLLERIVVALIESLLMRECQTRPWASGL